MGGEVGSFVGGPVGGEVGSIVGDPVGGEVGSKNATLERVLKQVFRVITAPRPESPLGLIVGVLASIHAEVREDEHDILTFVLADFDCCGGAAVLGCGQGRAPPSSLPRLLLPRMLYGIEISRRR